LEDLFSSEARMLDLAEREPVGPFLYGFGRFDWEMKSKLQDSDAEVLRACVPLKGHPRYTLYFVGRTRAESEVLVSLIRCSDLSDEVNAMPQTLSTFLKFTQLPLPVESLGFEFFNSPLAVRSAILYRYLLHLSYFKIAISIILIPQGLVFMLTGDRHNNRPVYRATMQHNVMYAYWSAMARRWVFASSIHESLEDRARAAAVIVEDVPRLDLATTRAFIRHAAVGTGWQPIPVVLELPKTGITYFQDRPGACIWSFSK
jgi:hypothetical protein